MWEPRCRVLKVTPTSDGEHLTLRVQGRAADGVINSTEVLWREPNPTLLTAIPRKSPAR
ncbi:hypothetical protein ACQWFT_24925, partial [Salmonella enterica subsp. enterica serovar Infantis]